MNYLSLSRFFCCEKAVLRPCNVGVYDGRLHHNMTAGKAPALLPFILQAAGALAALSHPNHLHK
ncbi:hypothetical protein C5Y41_16440 [Rahnella variigena]|nr:hypothetical protein C5Y41_16440 [Rahnella variigena]